MDYKKYFTMSYDDGVTQDKRFVELLNRYGLKCTFNINSGLFDHHYEVKGKEPSQKATHIRLPKDQIVALYQGHEIAAHGKMHLDMSQMAPEDLLPEIQEDVAALEALTGKKITGFVYAYGRYHEAALPILSDLGITYARLVGATKNFEYPKNPLLLVPTCSHNDPEVLTLIDAFIEAKATDQDLLFYMWGHTYEFDFSSERNNWAFIETLFQKIAGHKDIVYCTNQEAFQGRL